MLENIFLFVVICCNMRHLASEWGKCISSRGVRGWRDDETTRRLDGEMARRRNDGTTRRRDSYTTGLFFFEVPFVLSISCQGGVNVVPCKRRDLR